MPENSSRFVLLCQQSLAFALVAAVAAPAANIVTLDIVAPTRPGASGSVQPAPTGIGAGASPSLVGTAPVQPKVVDVPLSGVSATGLTALREGRPAVRLVAAEGDPETDDLAVLSAPQPVDSLATVGVTWKPGEKVADEAITVSVRSEKDGAWSGWQTMPYHDEHGPDPSSTEAQQSRPGTDPVYVGRVDDVQVKAVTDSGDAPEGMRLSLVDPGAQSAPTVQKPAIDTGALALSAANTGTGAAALSAGKVTARPMIYSRAQWGADERMRDRSSLRYGEVHAGFVHHTVNANNYTAAQVPAIIRGIYAYHTQSRGWSDVGYNFLVDRFGRIWEGRYGGVDRPVVGAHTLGYNDDAFAMSAIGNFETAQPSSALLDAYGRLFAWKLSLHGVHADSASQWVTKRYLPAINGHRDAGQTACPGRYLYAKLPTVRAIAESYEKSFAARNRVADLAGTARPDLVLRDRTTRQGYVLTSGSGASSGPALVPMGRIFPRANAVLNVGDWNGDGKGDVITRSSAGVLYLLRGRGDGTFSTAVRAATGFGSVRLLAAVGDITGDGYPDLMGQPSGRSMRIYPSNGTQGFRSSYIAHSSVTATQQVGMGLWNADGSPDSVVRAGDGSLVLYPGNGPGGLTGGTRIGSLGSGYDWLLAVGDVNGDRRPDLLVRERSTGTLWLVPGTSTGFGARTLFASGMARFDLAG